MLRASAAAIALLAPLAAAWGQIPASCKTPTDVRIFFQSVAPDISTAVYRGSEARAFVRALSAHSNPPPPQLRLAERTVAVGTYVASDQHVEIAFYENLRGMECRFWGTVGTTYGLDMVLKDMGTGA